MPGSGEPARPPLGTESTGTTTVRPIVATIPETFSSGAVSDAGLLLDKASPVDRGSHWNKAERNQPELRFQDEAVGALGSDPEAESETNVKNSLSEYRG